MALAPIVITAPDLQTVTIVSPTETPTYVLTAQIRGPAGPEGPPGQNGSPGTAVEFTQASPSDTWTIAHNLGFRPTVSVTTVGGVEIEGAEILHLSANTLQIFFDVAFAGFARLN